MKPIQLNTPPHPDARCDTLLGLIRHGRTDWNDLKRIQGHTDTDLNQTGRDQAQTWGQSLRGKGWQRIVTSDLQRARTTTEIINRALDLPVVIDPRLREQNWGEWTGHTASQLHNITNGEVEHQQALGWDFTPPEGESRRRVYLRGLAALADACRQWPGERVLVITHMGVRMVLAYGFRQMDMLPTSTSPIIGYNVMLTACRGANFQLLQTNADIDTEVTNLLRPIPA